MLIVKQFIDKNLDDGPTSCFERLNNYLDVIFFCHKIYTMSTLGPVDGPGQ